MLLGTTLVTFIPWLFFGGRDECGSFDPTMKTQWGYDFEDWWTLLHFQMSVNWFMAIALSCLILADHPPSCYVRESIRCVVFMFLGMLAKNTRTALYCCLGSDEDEDGVRDMVPDALMPATYAIAASLLSDIWCLQLVVARLRALQDAYGEPLGCTKLIRWGANLLVFWLFVLSACLFISTIATLVTSLCCVLGLAALGFLICRAYSVPLQVLRAAKRGTKEGPSGPHGVSKQLEKEASFAISVIMQAQVATLLANFSMIWHLTSWALTYVLPTTFINHTFEYGGLADTVGNTIGILLLINSSLRLPHCGKHFRAKLADTSEQSAARDVEEDAACQCGRHLATKVLTAFDDAALCERCAWEQKVQELAGRRITTAQLLDFHARLGRRHKARALPTLMPHFDPEKSTTNDVAPRLTYEYWLKSSIGVAEQTLKRSDSQTPRDTEALRTSVEKRLQRRTRDSSRRLHRRFPKPFGAKLELGHSHRRHYIPSDTQALRHRTFRKGTPSPPPPQPPGREDTQTFRDYSDTQALTDV